MSRRGETEDGLGWGGLVASKAEMRAEREHDAEVARLRAELERMREELACVRQALPEMWRDSVPSVAVATLEAENNALKREAHTWSKAAEIYAAELERYKPLMQAVEWLLDDGHMNQEHLARLRAAFELARKT